MPDLRRSPFRLLLAVVALALTLTGCNGPSPAHPVDEATAEHFQTYVEHLAHPRMEGRGAGYDGLDRARDYLADYFTTLGLEPAYHTGAGGEASYLQPFEMQLGAHASEQTLRLELPYEDRPFKAEHAFNALGFSGQGTFAGEAVFVGYGIVAPEHDYDSYAHLDDEGLDGKVAIAFRYEPVDADGRSLWAGVDARPGRFSDFASLPRKAEWAAERGAEALLVVDPPSLESAGPLRSTAGTTFDTEPASIPVMHIRPSTLHAMLRAADREPEAAVWTYEDRARRGVDRPDALNAVRLAGEVRLEHPHVTAHNVAGYVPGSGDLAEEVVVIGAHYDHLGFGEIGSMAHPEQLPALHPGADDNASGTAGLMLLAERAVERAAAEPETDRRSLLFVGFSGEEWGLLGSMHMVHAPEELAVDFEQIVAMLNLDMIGRLRDELFIFGIGSGDRWAELVAAVNDEVGLTLRDAAGGIGLSDQTSFYIHEIPVLHFFTGIHEDYHRPTDTADRINARGGARVVEFIDRLTRQLERDRQGLAFTGTADPHTGIHDDHDHDMLGIGRAQLGVMPDYATLEGEQGAGITATMPGSPAERAGLEAGDRILRWGDEPVANVRGLTRALREAEPGERVELLIERDGEQQTITVELGER